MSNTVLRDSATGSLVMPQEGAGCSQSAEAPKGFAERAEALLPDIARRLFTLSPDNPLGNLPYAQLKVCFLLLNGSRTMSQVSEELSISVSAVTQLADRLEKGGLVERRTAGQGDDGDRRTRYLTLTAHGHELMAGWRQWRVERVASALSYLSLEQQESVVNALETMLDACIQFGEGKSEQE